MTISRRTILRAVPVASLLGIAGLAACSDPQSSSGVSASETAASGPLTLGNASWSYDADNDVYYQVGLSYVASPQDPAHETLGIVVPGAYLTATDNGDGTFIAEVAAQGTVGLYTAATAPIVLPVNTPGYSSQAALSEYSYDAVAAYMEAGLIYVHAGLRGKDSTSDTADGNAPWGVADLKAAVRYLRYNAASLPGDMEQVYVFGHSGGGAQSAVMGASGDCELYNPYLETLGAAMKGIDGQPLSDAVAGAMCWCPITSLDAANAGYEWNMGQFASSGTRAAGTWTEAYSKDLAAAYAEHVNSLGLTSSDGTALTLEESPTGVYLQGSYYDHLVGIVEQSLNDFLAATAFPYTPDSTQMAGMGAAEGGSGSVPSGAPPAGGPGAANGSQATDGTGQSTTYETVEDYIASLNADTQWVTYDSATNTATITGLESFVTSQKSATKDVGAMDGVDRGQTENVVLGVGPTSLHFSQISRDAIAAGEARYAGLSGWSDDYGSSGYDADFATSDSVGTEVLTREQMYDPMSFLAGASTSVGTSTVAPRWRIRTGIQQGDTASTVEVNLALALTAAGADVDFATVWGQGHTMAELTGTGEDNVIAWIKEAASA